MMSKIILMNGEATEGICEDDRGAFSGPIPPLSGEYRPRYDALVAAGVVPMPYVVPGPVVPTVISDRQFFQQLAAQGTITPLEALDAVKIGAIPLALQTQIDVLPTAAERFSATMLVAGGTQFERAHPTTAQLGTLMGWSASDLDSLWTAAAKL